MNTHAFWVITEKELRAIAQEGTILIAFAIQLFIASFSSALLVGLMSVYDPDAVALSVRFRVRLGVLGQTDSRLVTVLKERNARISLFASPEEAQAAFQAGQIDATLYIPPDWPQQTPASGDVEDQPRLKLYIPQSEAYETLIMMVLRKPLKDYENELRQQNGIQVNYLDIGGQSSTTFEFQYGVLLPLLMFFPAFVTGGMVVDSISEELANHTLETLWSAPLRLSTILAAKISAALLLAGGQCGLWAILVILNGIPIQNLALVWLLAVLTAALIAVAAALTALYFKDRERSQFVYSLFIVLMTSLSYFFNASPTALTARLAVGDPYAGLADVALYGLALAGLAAVFFTTAERLVAAPA